MKEERIIQGDCLEEMDKLIAEGIVVDAIICDLPFGITACKWDTVIPFEPMWERLNKLIKPNGAIVLFGSEPFSSALRMSNIKDYKYDWVWDKVNGRQPYLAKIQPIKSHEMISVFGNGRLNYFPIMKKAKKENMRERIKNNFKGVDDGVWGKMKEYTPTKDEKLRYPLSVVSFNMQDAECNQKFRLHPTQKPVALMEYLIKTYTNEGELVLDFTAGSGTTGLAAKNLNRNFILIEKEPRYIEIIKSRLSPTSKNY